MSNKNQDEKLNNNVDAEAKEAKSEMALDDAARVKVLSPARLVFKRFIRNKLAILGTIVLLILFLFCFLGPVFYPYEETEVFKGWREQNTKYAFAQIRTVYENYWHPDCDDDDKKELSFVHRNVNSTIKKMLESENEADKLTYKIQSENNYYELVKFNDNTYALRDSTYVQVADFSGSALMGGICEFVEGFENPGEGFSEAAAAGIKSGSFEFNGKTYDIVKDPKGNKQAYDIFTETSESEEPFYYFVASTLIPTFYNDDDFYAFNKDSTFKYYAYLAAQNDGKFEYNGVSFEVKLENDVQTVYKNGEACAFFQPFTAVSSDNATALGVEFQKELEKVVSDMNAEGASVGSEVRFTALAPEIAEGKTVLDENGNKVLKESEFIVKREQNDYTVWANNSTYVILIYEAPNAEHLLGTDANGMDVLARIMYGGRISLLVGFVVVFIEMVLGVIMGGIAGYFGGWVDNLIMRLVDVFYCIPSMPILIITGALFDAQNLDYKTRLVWMMAILGFLGWAGVARMVRGQILSLREQEFMVAAEASGLSTRRRIFRHLVPNVMPQLIVQATMGLGGVIITESTLSFLGLGVKHPLATWGNMMNNITQKVEYLTAYAYIWVPIGCLICLAVIAFNFVGDGLRDAFDPKMKR